MMPDFGLDTPVIGEFAAAFRLVRLLSINVGFRRAALAIVGAGKVNPLAAFDNRTRIDVEYLFFGTIPMEPSEASRPDFNVVEPTTVVCPDSVKDTLRLSGVVVIHPNGDSDAFKRDVFKFGPIHVYPRIGLQDDGFFDYPVFTGNFAFNFPIVPVDGAIFDGIAVAIKIVVDRQRRIPEVCRN